MKVMDVAPLRLQLTRIETDQRDGRQHGGKRKAAERWAEAHDEDIGHYQ